MAIELKARAKINLSLDVLNKRPDGYHNLRMIMQTVDLYDRVFIETAAEGIEVKCNCRWVPSGSGNIAYKAANLILRECQLKHGVRIKIEKNIPVAAGLAGGSSDAAAVLKGVNKLFSLGLKENELMALGKQVGADVPYCIRGGTMLAEGIGEILTELPSLTGVSIILVKPKIGVSTAWVYSNLDLSRLSDRPDTDLLIAAVRDKRLDIIAKNMKNVLETVTIPKHGIILDIKNKLIELGAMGSMMSGSGPSVFGIFPDKQTARSAYEKIKSGKWLCFLTETICEER